LFNITCKFVKCVVVVTLMAQTRTKSD